MNPRVNNLKALVADGHYVIDEPAVAEAMLLRTVALRVLPEMAFRCVHTVPQVRSFRPHRGARSFRLTRAPHAGRCTCATRW